LSCIFDRETRNPTYLQGLKNQERNNSSFITAPHPSAFVPPLKKETLSPRGFVFPPQISSETRAHFVHVRIRRGDLMMYFGVLTETVFSNGFY
jgi:hypothetical protein